MKHCGLHDVVFPDDSTCWNCEESKFSPEDREAHYSDPEFLARRGGRGVTKQIQMNSTMNKLADLKPEQLDALIALAKGEKPQRTVIGS